ncbi:prepilin-type N-terminal cleavage/methylation domain-containing protein [Caulobacter sp. AP07]|uniref:prepilin-type N-terminal cleavage/methylation domain-containing protein n=1 Tax=Caulobacter sp. AP07 TaxID=1144304 RepID=UPI000271F733|nr:prepilin-type N-terminal cleavage/methylation domain-containing protein [Caulobacter sp. AP07]EJL35638.1 prepilin-type N-terminal cleavage/methylation domain-containing protein [Caulobacter sp. AP07]
MSDDGYTLAEMLAALTILGLAMGGLGLVVSLITRQQLTASRIQTRLVDDRAADQALTRLLAQAEAGEVQGDGRSLSFACGETTCGASLQADRRRTFLILQGRAGPARRLRLREQGVRFSYVGDGGAIDAWPRTDSPIAGGSSANVRPETLRVILLTAPGSAAPLAVGRVWTREARDCQFDAIIGACRAVTP